LKTSTSFGKALIENMRPRPLLAAFAPSMYSVNAAFNIFSGSDANLQFKFGMSEKCMTALYVYNLSYYSTDASST
jgi:hypothetical protein